MRKYKKELENKVAVEPGNFDGQIIGDELCKFVQLLVDYGICGDSGTIDNAGKYCKSKATENSWCYNGSINFSLDNFGKSYPHDHKDLSLKFDINISAEKLISDAQCDPLKSLNFNIIISGISEEKGKIIGCWHLDKHEKNVAADHYSHPKYHFTFGGHHLPQIGNYGEAIILNTPRIAYPPMDAVLGIDFIVQNYIDIRKTKKLLNDSIYREIVDKSQQRLWKPYFQSISAKWEYENNIFDEKYNHNKLLPFLL